jgi:class 3 adenylate cyclase
MLGLNRLSIQSKMIVLLLAVSLCSIAVIAGIGYRSAKEALTASVENQLQGVRVAKTTTLKEMLGALRDQAILMSDSRMVIDAMLSFNRGYRDLSSKILSSDEQEQLKNFYQNDFLPKLAPRLEGQPVLDQYLPASPAEKYLQYQYIAANPHPYQQKQDLNQAAKDDTLYGQTHAKFHPFFARAVKIFGFEDMMLVDPETLDVVYSYQKTTEFATNLRTGPYSNTNLGDRVRAIRAARDRDDFKIADFESFRPSLGTSMGFAMSPIFDGTTMVGILVLQFPIELFNRVLTGDYNWTGEGLGQTGECYVVGPDKTLRSRSRFMRVDPDGFYESLREAGVSAKTIAAIQRQGSAMNLVSVTTPGVEKALRGQSGLEVTTDYRGKRVLSAYGPLEVDSLRWAVIADMDEDEATAPIRKFGRRVVIASSAMALLVSLLALISSYALTRPLRELTEGARRLGAGQTDVKVRVTSRDEFGELGVVFNEMADNIRTQTDRLEDQVNKNQELLLSILPASAVAQRQEGDEKASREFSDVSVMFCEILGLEEFSARVSDAKALSALGDLIATFDDAADKLAIEKVRSIGASYLAVCGLSVARPDHARRMVQFAAELARIVSMFNREHKSELSVAVGINSGPVVGGVVGRRKFLYDLWGDTVTIARKLAAGKGAAIRVTQGVKNRMGDEFSCSGPIQVDGEGKPSIEAWQIAV